MNKRADSIPAKRRYNSPLRQQQSEATRQRIIAAGAELVHGFTAWDWTNLTAGAVAERAGVSERTVHRHFSTERKLRDAVIQRLVEESGVDLGELAVEDFGDVTAHMFSYLSSFSVAPPVQEDPTFATMDAVRRRALMDAVVRATPQWSDADRETVAAAMDLLWDLPPFERLRSQWEFDQERAVHTLRWLIGLIQRAIAEDRRPGAGD